MSCLSKTVIEHNKLYRSNKSIFVASSTASIGVEIVAVTRQAKIAIPIDFGWSIAGATAAAVTSSRYAKVDVACVTTMQDAIFHLVCSGNQSYT